MAAVVLALAPAAAAAGSTEIAADGSPLAGNGFASPSCTSALLTSQLSDAERTNCAASGVDVAPDPLSNYAIDVNIPSGLDASVTDDLDTVVQDLLVTPVWTALVWLIHVVLVALEWCYAIDLLAPSTLARVSSSLGVARRIFTDPWLGLALAIAAVGFAWQGLVRRRVLDTLGQAALLSVMVCAGLWIIADPVGTVGAVGNLADRAALTTVAASATGNPDQPVSSVDGAFGSVFDAAISGPWCYLEFGDVEWCRQPAELDPNLRATAAKLVLQLRAQASCQPPPGLVVQCEPGGGALQSQLAGAATALAAARTNGQLFLALPPGALERNALSNQTVTPTLYGTLCGATDPTACTAATAPQAEFRGAAGTWPRVGGLLLIAAGTLGMLLLLGFIALRLLGAALATLLYLMLAPLAVLAPALGESGRDTFRLWLTRLLGAALAKLVYSVALGVVLLIATLLSSLDGLGWWTQWLLMSVFWWTAFEQRHRLLALVMHERGEPQRRAPMATRVWLAARSAGAGVGVARAGGRAVARVGGGAVATFKSARDLPQEGGSLTAPRSGRGDPPRPGMRASVRSRAQRRQEAGDELAAQVARVRQAGGVRPAVGLGGTVAASPAARAELQALEFRRSRIATSLRSAEASGDRRRAVSLRLRARRLDDELSTHRAGAAALGSPGPVGRLRSAFSRGSAEPRSDLRERRAVARTLDRAAAGAPREVLRSGPAAARLAGLAGISPDEYLRRAPAQQRAARLEIERELARRRQLLRDAAPVLGRPRRGAAAAPTAGSAAPAVPAPIARRARQFGSRPR